MRRRPSSENMTPGSLSTGRFYFVHFYLVYMGVCSKGPTSTLKDLEGKYLVLRNELMEKLHLFQKSSVNSAKQAQLFQVSNLSFPFLTTERRLINLLRAYATLLCLSHKYVSNIELFVSDGIIFYSWRRLCICHLFIHPTNLFVRVYCVPHAFLGVRVVEVKKKKKEETDVVLRNLCCGENRERSWGRVGLWGK